MGILDSLSQNTPHNPPLAQETASPHQPQPTDQGEMAQMYEFVMQNALQAISQVAEKRIHELGPEEGIADLVASAMVANLEAAQQNGKTIPVPVMLQMAKDLTMHLLQQVSVPPEELDDVFPDIILRALARFGEMSDGMLLPEEEQQYLQAINQISELDQQRQTPASSSPTAETAQPMPSQGGDYGV